MFFRLVRYLLLVLTLLLAGVWVRSYWPIRMHFDRSNAPASLEISRGKIDFWFVHPMTEEVAKRYYEHRDNDGYLVLDSVERLKFAGLEFNSVIEDESQLDFVSIPMILIFAPASLLGSILWYRPIRNRLRGKTQSGFEVEAKATRETPC